MKNFIMVVLGFLLAIAVVKTNDRYHYLDGPTKMLQDTVRGMVQETPETQVQ